MNVIKRIREEHGYTKTQMARCLGICKSYYTMIENGDRPISKKVGLKIHSKFAVPLDDIFLHQEFKYRKHSPTIPKTVKKEKEQGTSG
ncbi:MAG: helix-turn-helix transcriptional regulator [Firmicutes bacterium]|nr:helix-turn-helix transcriptional regulator [Bacillota bacterium]